MMSDAAPQINFYSLFGSVLNQLQQQQRTLCRASAGQSQTAATVTVTVTEHNHTEVDMSQVQHVDPNCRGHFFFGDAYIYMIIHTYIFIPLYIYTRFLSNNGHSEVSTPEMWAVARLLYIQNTASVFRMGPDRAG